MAGEAATAAGWACPRGGSGSGVTGKRYWGLDSEEIFRGSNAFYRRLKHHQKFILFITMKIIFTAIINIRSIIFIKHESLLMSVYHMNSSFYKIMDANCIHHQIRRY
jgi:hypothetical protein